jgi:geranylgeranylglycerol-phosphate geranylgeranyltransferase
MTVGERVGGLVELTRPANAIVAGVLTFTGAFIAEGAGVLGALPAVCAAVVATICATAAGNAINDYFDRDIDRVNRPDRPIPRGAVSPRGALAWSGSLFLVAAGLAIVVLPTLAIVIAVVNVLALITYTEYFKGLPGVGNALVAYLGGSTFLFGGAAVGSVRATVVLAALAALSTLAREIIKDVEDIAGDRAEGLTTLPISIGERPALYTAVVALAVAVLASPLPYLMGIFGLSYLLLVAPADLVMMTAAYRSFGDPSTGQSQLKYGMFLAAAAFIGSRCVVLWSA